MEPDLLSDPSTGTGTGKKGPGVPLSASELTPLFENNRQARLLPSYSGDGWSREGFYVEDDDSKHPEDSSDSNAVPFRHNAPPPPPPLQLLWGVLHCGFFAMTERPSCACMFLTILVVTVCFIVSAFHRTNSAIAYASPFSEAGLRLPPDAVPDSGVLSFGRWSHPLSSLRPDALNVSAVYERSSSSYPNDVLSNLRSEGIPLPTNCWCENLFLGDRDEQGTSGRLLNHGVYQIPYVIDFAGPITGMRTSPTRVVTDPSEVKVVFEVANSVTMGAVEDINPQHRLVTSPNPCQLQVAVEWQSIHQLHAMQGFITRGSPYSSQQYTNATPRIVWEQQFLRTASIDGQSVSLGCGNKRDEFHQNRASIVQRYIQLHLMPSDMTWLLFFSEPVEIVCSSLNGTVEQLDASLEIRATKPLHFGTVRVSLLSNCSTGTNAQFCDGEVHASRPNEEFAILLIHHSAALSQYADMDFGFPSDDNEGQEVATNSKTDHCPSGYFHWFLDWHVEGVPPGGRPPPAEHLIYALPYHTSLFHNATMIHRILSVGCTPTLYGLACPVMGNRWVMEIKLHPVSFFADKTPRKELGADIRRALDQDLRFQLPPAQTLDTYFSGKMIAKLARILIVAADIGELADVSDVNWHTHAHEYPGFLEALDNLKDHLAGWFGPRSSDDRSSFSPWVYDGIWGGFVSCGRKADGVNDACPDLFDPERNFGIGFYNDHHFHYGYFIYAAAVVSYFDYQWGIDHFEHVLLLIRDIANPSVNDGVFTMWRHKDWFVGVSWASGISTLPPGNIPYPNGRNQESVSEAINAYEAIGLFGQAMYHAFSRAEVAPHALQHGQDLALRIRDHGRMLLSTELHAAHLYYHITKQGNMPHRPRVFGDRFTGKVVGIMWSTLVQEKIWFGKSQMYESFGIQMIPLTSIARQRDSLQWLNEIMPDFNSSCTNPTVIADCQSDGWIILLYANLAAIGNWENARDLILRLDDAVYSSPAGDGQSKSNTLWFIATR